MENLFIAIRHMTSDSRMISIYYSMPQYKIDQLKSKLFLVANNQDRDTCEWWLRLYHGEGTKDDIKRLTRLLDGIK